MLTITYICADTYKYVIFIVITGAKKVGLHNSQKYT